MFPFRYGRRNSGDSPTPVAHTRVGVGGGGQICVICVCGREHVRWRGLTVVGTHVFVCLVE